MQSNKRKTTLLISGILVLVIVFHVVGWLAPIENLFRTMLNPASAGVYQFQVTLDEHTKDFESVEELETAYENLFQEHQSLQAHAARVSVLEQENKNLQEQLHFFTTTNFEHVGARVIGKNIEPLSSSVILNVGSEQGIEEGNPVIVSEGILVGTVARVTENTAVVRLIDDNQSKIGASIENDDQTIGLIEGGFGISVRLTFVPQNELISVGDVVVTSGLTEEIPRGLLIGTIEAIEKEAYQPFQEAVVQPATDLNKLYVVSVVTRSQSS